MKKLYTVYEIECAYEVEWSFINHFNTLDEAEAFMLSKVKDFRSYTIIITYTRQ